MGLTFVVKLSVLSSTLWIAMKFNLDICRFPHMIKCNNVDDLTAFTERNQIQFYHLILKFMTKKLQN